MNINDFRSTIGGYDGDTFMSSLPDICQKMSNELKILTFAIIVYDESTPEIRRILQDQLYWDALEKATRDRKKSPDRLVVFCLGDREKLVPKVRKQGGSMINTEFVVMWPKPTEWDYEESYSQLIKVLLGEKETLRYPSIIFFQVQDGVATSFISVPMKRADAWKSCRAMQEVIELVSNVLSDVQPEYFGNREQIINLVKTELINRKYMIYAHAGFKLISHFAEVFKTLKGE